MIDFDASTSRLGIRRPTNADCDEFISLIQASKSMHEPWVNFADSRERYFGYVQSRNGASDDGFLVCDRASSRIVGLINLNCIVRGYLQSAYLGYAVGAPYARQGYMCEGITLVAQYAFGTLKLHRLEANIQPKNLASIGLVKKCGFQQEGFSPRYLMVGGEWKDHERWALLAD